MRKSITKANPSTIDAKTHTYKNGVSGTKSIYSKATKASALSSASREGHTRNKSQKADDIFSKGPSRTVVNDVTATTN